MFSVDVKPGRLRQGKNIHCVSEQGPGAVRVSESKTADARGWNKLQDEEHHHVQLLQSTSWMSNQEGSDEHESREVHVTFSSVIFKARYMLEGPIPVAARSKAWVYGVGLRPIACWDCGFESRRGHGCLSLVSVVCCQVEVSAMGWSLVQRSPTERGVSKNCDREATTMRRPRPPRGCRAIGRRRYVRRPALK
jgi:hypothetical protein